MICDVHTYLVWKLAGEWKTSWASADPLGMFDLKRKKWSPVILDALGLDQGQLPLACEPGTVLGTISQSSSRSTGLRMGTLVVAGGGDGQCAGLGSNVLTGDRAYLNLGTAVVAGTFGKQYRTSTAFRTMSSCAESGYYYECSLRAGTFSLDWFIGKVLQLERKKNPEIYGVLEREAGRVPPGSDGVMYLPYLCGVMNPYWDINARGAFVGLSSGHHRGHLYRAMLEGIACEQALAMNAVERETGVRVKEFVAIGGGAASRVWCSIMADVTRRNISLPVNIEASALGAAIAGSVGAGLHKTFAEAARRMTGISKTLIPDERRRKIYGTLLKEYERIYPAIHPQK
jgi:xylulokinase